MTKASLRVVACVALLWAGTAFAAPTPAEICAAAKLTAAGNKAKSKSTCYSKSTKKGGSFDLTTCLQNAEDSFSKAVQKAVNKGGCAYTGDAAAIEGTVDTFIAAEVAQILSVPPPGPAVDNGDGTITDPVTGLMWEKKSYDGSIHDKGNTYSWADAHTLFLDVLNTAPCFAGHCDWRLPNEDGLNIRKGLGPKELESIRSVAGECPGTLCIDPIFNSACGPGCKVTECSCTEELPGTYGAPVYWTSTPDSASAGWYYGINFGQGYAPAAENELYPPSKAYVRAVRTAP